MSEIANWSYTTTFEVKPFLKRDLSTQKSIFGDIYEIKGSYIGGGEQARESGSIGGARGAEFVSKYSVFTESKEPKYLDMIRVKGQELWDEIRKVEVFDMSAFDDIDDVLLVT